MRLFIVTALLAFLTGGCATMSYSIDGDKDEVDVVYQGTASGAAKIADAFRRRQEARAASKLETEAVKRGLPIQTRSTSRVRTMHSSGYWGNGFGPFGNGMYPYQMSPAVAASQAATFQRYGYLPVLPRTTALPPPGSRVHSGGRVVCPRNRSPTTIQERQSCLEKSHRVMLRRVYRKHR